jgi:hypothetical protein
MTNSKSVSVKTSTHTNTYNAVRSTRTATLRKQNYEEVFRWLLMQPQANLRRLNERAMMQANTRISRDQEVSEEISRLRQTISIS